MRSVRAVTTPYRSRAPRTCRSWEHGHEQEQVQVRSCKQRCRCTSPYPCTCTCTPNLHLHVLVPVLQRPALDPARAGRAGSILAQEREKPSAEIVGAMRAIRSLGAVARCGRSVRSLGTVARWSRAVRSLRAFTRCGARTNRAKREPIFCAWFLVFLGREPSGGATSGLAAPRSWWSRVDGHESRRANRAKRKQGSGLGFSCSWARTSGADAVRSRDVC